MFIPTTWRKFMAAAEINDLCDESPLEDLLWAELKKRGIRAERQFFVKANGKDYCLDFAIFCNNGKLDVETDGDVYHANRQRSPGDNDRNNDLGTEDWTVLRFTTDQIKNQMNGNCIAKIKRNIDKMGGVNEGKGVPRLVGSKQKSLFDIVDPRC